jgi:hypothetical protein
MPPLFLIMLVISRRVRFHRRYAYQLNYGLFFEVEKWLTNNSYLQHISLVNSTVNFNIEGSKYTVSITLIKKDFFSGNVFVIV